MNNSTSYEKLLAQKIEQLPLPDKVNEIWAAIEHELDFPVEVTHQEISNRHRKWLKLALSALIIVVVILWFLIHNRQRATPKSEPLPERIPERNSKLQDRDSNVVNDHKNEPGSLIIPLSSDIKDTLQLIDNAITIDSVDKELFPQFLPDSIQNDNRLIRIDSTLSMPAPPVKKPKGIKGISEKDYKIVESVNKDTAKQKN